MGARDRREPCRRCAVPVGARRRQAPDDPVIQSSPSTCSPTLVDRLSGVMTIAVAQSGAFGAVADPRLLQRRRADGAGRRRVHRDAAGHRLRRRGRGAVPVRGDDARHRFRRAARRLRALSGRSALLLAIVLLAEIIFARRRLERGRRSSWRRAAPRRSPTRCPISRRSARCSTRAICSSSKAAGLVLLVAMIGAIVLTHRKRRDVRAAEHRPPDPPPPAGCDASTCSPASGRGWSCDRHSSHLSARRRRDPVRARRARHLPQPQERDRHPDGDRADPARGEHQPRRLLAPSWATWSGRCSRCSC